MKIQYISNSSLFSETADVIHVLKMCDAFTESGHDVRLHAYRRKGPVDLEKVSQHYGLERRFALTTYPASEDVSQRLASIFAAVHASSDSDLIYSRNLLAAAVCAWLGANVILEMHTPISKRKSAQHAFRKLSQSSKLKRLVVITDTLRDHYVTRYPWLRNRITVAPDGADRAPMNLQPVKLNSKGQLQVGYTGQLYQGKGMEVIAALLPLCPWAHFTIVGGAEDHIAHWSEVTADNRNITFVGQVPHSQVAKYIAAFDVVLLPNQPIVSTEKGTDIGSWTSPLKLFEYMSLGRAIVSSDLPVLREILQDGHNSLLAQPHDLTSWTTSLARLRDDPNLRQRLGAKARAEFESVYTWRARAEKVLQWRS